MRILVDTRAWLWWLQDCPRLSDEARSAISDRRNEIFLSVVSLWEIACNHRRVQIAGTSEKRLREWLERDGFHILPLEAGHVLYAIRKRIPSPEPFTQLMIAQAVTRGLVVVTNDRIPFDLAHVDVIVASGITARGRSGGRGARSRSSRPTG